MTKEIRYVFKPSLNYGVCECSIQPGMSHGDFTGENPITNNEGITDDSRVKKNKPGITDFYREICMLQINRK